MDNVERAKRRFRDAHPEFAHETDEERHVRLQVHVPRMCARMNRDERNAKLRGDRELQLKCWAERHKHCFSVDIAEDHAVMSAGQVSNTVFVTVIAEDAVEAHYLAAAMASRHGIAVRVRKE